MTTLPSVTLEGALAEIDRIARVTNAPLRNLLITQAYSELSNALASVIGAGNANWSSFATWASKTAGRTIRGEDVPREVVKVLGETAQLETHLAALSRRIPALLWIRAKFDALDIARALVAEIGEQIAVGNLKVFAELAPLFARFYHTFSAPRQRTPMELEAFVARLAPGDAASGGQDALRLAFTSYLAAAQATSSKERAELILYGNVLIGLHEQTRLQPNIQAAIDAPISPGVYRKLAAGTIWAMPGFHALFRRQMAFVFESIREPWEQIVTRHLMRLAMPRGSSLPLGHDLTVAGQPFPPDLDPLHHPPLVALVSTYDPNLDSLRGSGALNWTNLANRMAFIADLFRSHQCDALMFEPPFTPAQLSSLRAGDWPAGPL